MRMPHVCILRTDGTNCDEETATAFQMAGAVTSFVHVNELRSRDKCLADFQILALSGGFSYGDDVASGQILANELVSNLGDDIQRFVEASKPILGICNGFQVLIRTGLLPFGQLGKVCATLTNNESGRFECRWVKMVTENEPGCVFRPFLIWEAINLPVAHGEGRFFAEPATLEEIERQNLVVLRYSHEGEPTMEFPYNPNGSVNSIAGICDPSGCIFGMMPHPERFTRKVHFPNWRRGDFNKPDGLQFFASAVNYAAQL
ncbi:MAG: phosphoribosylformylglycinamidine synthase I [Candidatus Berkelbacteria bacterium]|nr:phosphoribosylformylglycinamidine synthase I [Candidatus Berkelbacteria bacterium]MCR4307942.1 phosphoribosylformylglycinamidine synthase I [Candidatus Berkelbacteria bacterium]